MTTTRQNSIATASETRRRLFGSLCSIVLLVNLARVVYAPLLEPLMDAFEMTPGTAGLVATLVWVGSALPRIPTGYLLTSVARHHVVLATGLVLTAASAFTTIVDSVILLGASAFLMGLASGAYFVAANPLVSELYPERVGRALGIHGVASQLAAVGAPLFVTLVLARGSWRGVFAIIAALAFGSTVVFYRVAKRATLPDAGSDDRDLLAAIRHQWRLILVGIVILGAVGFVWQGLFNFYVSYLTDAKALSQNAARMLLTVVFAAGVPAFWASGRLADRLPIVPYLLSIIAAFVAILLALTAATGFLALVVVTALLGYVVHSIFPALDTFLLGSLPDHHRASAYATYSGAMMVVQATGSSVVGELVENGYAYDAVFRGLAGLLVVVLLALVGLFLVGRLPNGARNAEEM